MCAATLINRMGTMALPFLVLYLAQGLGWRAEEAGTALLVYGAAALATSPFSGRPGGPVGAPAGGNGEPLGERFHSDASAPRPESLGRSTLWFSCGRPCTQAFAPGAMALLAAVADPGRRRAVFSLQRLAVNLGMSVGPALGGLIAHQSYAWVFRTDGLTTLAAALLLALFPFRRAAPAASPAEGVHGSAWKNLNLARLLFGFLLVLLVFTQIEGALPLWVVQDLGLGNPFFGLLFTVNTLAIVTLEVPLNLRMAAWSHRHQMLLGSCCYAVGFGLTHPVGHHPAQAGGRGTALDLRGDDPAAGRERCCGHPWPPPERRGEYLGLYSATFAARFHPGPLAGGPGLRSARTALGLGRRVRPGDPRWRPPRAVQGPFGRPHTEILRAHSNQVSHRSGCVKLPADSRHVRGSRMLPGCGRKAHSGPVRNASGRNRSRSIR